MSSLIFYYPQVSISMIFEKSLTNGPTDRRTDQRTDGRTKPLIELLFATKNHHSL